MGIENKSLDYQSDLEWESFLSQVTLTMRNFETCISDHRVALKGYLLSLHIRPAIKVATRVLSQIQTLLRILLELELDFCISRFYTRNDLFLIVNAYVYNLDLGYCKDTLKRFMDKFTLFCKQKEGELELEKEVIPLCHLVDHSRDAIHFIIKIVVGCLLKMDIHSSELVNEHMRNLQLQCEFDIHIMNTNEIASPLRHQSLNYMREWNEHEDQLSRNAAFHPNKPYIHKSDLKSLERNMKSQKDVIDVQVFGSKKSLYDLTMNETQTSLSKSLRLEFGIDGSGSFL